MSSLPAYLMLAIAVKGSKVLPVPGLICVVVPNLQQGLNEPQNHFWKEAGELSPLIFFFFLSKCVWTCFFLFFSFFFSCFLFLFDSLSRSLLKCSLALALDGFHRQISACVILNPKHSISSSMFAGATKIQVEKPHVVILIFQDWPTFCKPFYSFVPGGLDGFGGQQFLSWSRPYLGTLSHMF